MNCQLNQTSEPTQAPSPVVVSLLLTETATRTSSAEISAANELILEAAMRRRADAMTDVLTGIMERPLTQRFWGLNE